MKPINTLQNKIKFVLTDIDDTLTENGQLPSESYESLWKLKSAGIKVIPVTGRPAGWCDMIARLWPVDAVIGENGGFYFRYENKKMKRWNFFNQTQRSANRIKLDQIKSEILQEVPNAAISEDQFCRQYDLAIDFCEDIPRLTELEIQKIVSIFHKHGATAKISSIHVNGWFGTFNKVTTAYELLKNEFHLTEKDIQENCLYAGDSPNDEPFFAAFENSVGVANVLRYQHLMKSMPKYICQNESAKGFCELTEFILRK